MEHDAVVARVRALTDPLLAARRVELVELQYRREGPHVVLRFVVETVAGITVGQCGELSRAIGAVLDEHDALTIPYLLEVASPGLDRLLRTAQDFERVMGRRVRLQAMASAPDGPPALADGEPGAVPRPGQELVGTVVSVGEERLTLRLDQGETVRVALATVAWARQEMLFGRGTGRS